MLPCKSNFALIVVSSKLKVQNDVKFPDELRKLSIVIVSNCLSIK